MTVTRRSTVLVAFVAALWLVSPGVALGYYSHTTAAAYADAHWNSCGVSGVYPCINDDCTNFVSQSLHQGGYPYVNVGGDPQDYRNWYVIANQGHVVTWSLSFTESDRFEQFLVYDIPGGYPQPVQPGDTLAEDSAAGTGDVLFYDWDNAVNPRRWDHTTIVVGFGLTDDGYYGDYLDQHTPYRHHTFWTGRSFNTHIATTKILPMRIDSNN